jgi:hypothetical protein
MQQTVNQTAITINTTTAKPQTVGDNLIRKVKVYDRRRGERVIEKVRGITI